MLPRGLGEQVHAGFTVTLPGMELARIPPHLSLARRLLSELPSQRWAFWSRVILRLIFFLGRLSRGCTDC